MRQNWWNLVCQLVCQATGGHSRLLIFSDASAGKVRWVLGCHLFLPLILSYSFLLFAIFGSIAVPLSCCWLNSVATTTATTATTSQSVSRSGTLSPCHTVYLALCQLAVVCWLAATAAAVAVNANSVHWLIWPNHWDNGGDNGNRASLLSPSPCLPSSEHRWRHHCWAITPLLLHTGTNRVVECLSAIVQHWLLLDCLQKHS